jgi:hypothetical protein
MNDQGEGKGFLEPFDHKKSTEPVPGYLIALKTSRYMVSYFDPPVEPYTLPGVTENSDEGIDSDTPQYSDLEAWKKEHDVQGAQVIFFDNAAEAIMCYDVLSQEDLDRGEISNLNIAVIVKRETFSLDPSEEGDDDE